MLSAQSLSPAAVLHASPAVRSDAVQSTALQPNTSNGSHAAGATNVPVKIFSLHGPSAATAGTNAVATGTPSTPIDQAFIDGVTGQTHGATPAPVPTSGYTPLGATNPFGVGQGGFPGNSASSLGTSGGFDPSFTNSFVSQGTDTSPNAAAQGFTSTTENVSTQIGSLESPSTGAQAIANSLLQFDSLDGLNGSQRVENASVGLNALATSDSFAAFEPPILEALRDGT